MQTDPNWSNFLYDEATRTINLIDFGAARDYSKSFVDDYLRMVNLLFLSWLFLCSWNYIVENPQSPSVAVKGPSKPRHHHAAWSVFYSCYELSMRVIKMCLLLMPVFSSGMRSIQLSFEIHSNYFEECYSTFKMLLELLHWSVGTIFLRLCEISDFLLMLNYRLLPAQIKIEMRSLSCPRDSGFSQERSQLSC